MIYTITMNPSIDQHITINKLIKDDTLKASSIYRDPGGKGINVARVIKELGGETKAFGITGGCAGYMLKDLLDRHDLDYQFFEIMGETRINFIMTDLSDKTQTRISAPGPEADESMIAQFVSMLERANPRPAFWVFGGSLLPGLPPDTYKQLIKIFNARGEKCVLDADGEALKWGIQASPSFIKPNEFELGRLLGKDLRDEEDIAWAAGELCHKYGIEVVAVSLGKKGALFVQKTGVLKIDTPDVEVRTRVGAGDSMIGGFLTALDGGHDIEIAARMAVAAGTAAVMKEGTKLCLREDVERLFGLITAKPLDYTQNKVKDIVCNMEVEKTKAVGGSEYQNERFHFCSLLCKKKFDLDPEKYLKRRIKYEINKQS